MFERFAATARNVVRDAVDEARRRGDRRVGTDHLLLGLLGGAEGAALLGVGLAAARSTADELDRRALAAIGLDAGEGLMMGVPSAIKRVPFTSGARSVIKESLAFTMAEKARKISPRHLALALLERERPDPAAELLAGLGVDREALRVQLTRPAAA